MMKGLPICLRIFFIYIATTEISKAQEVAVIKDFGNDWMVYENEHYKAFAENSGKVKTIYFLIEANKYSGGFLHLNSSQPITLFINGQLIAKGDAPITLSVDSLSGILQSSKLQVSVHQDEIRRGGLQTIILFNDQEATTIAEPVTLRFSFFRDFVIVGMLVLMVMLIVIIQLNTKLASDYFSIAKIFSIREAEESQGYSRITSSINILFYAYCSLMLAYFLMIIFHYVPAHYALALSFQANTFWEAIVLWLELSLVVLGVFFIKIALVYGLSFVFGMPEIGGIHFFNWVRLLLGVFGVLTVVLFLYFISHGQQELFYISILRMISWVLAGWLVLIVFKLYRQAGHSMFHLFSYICATELIPFLITIKVLYY